MRTDLDEATKGTCENCHTEDVWIRRIPSVDWMTKKIRRYWNICFDCVGPVKYWQGRYGEMKTPLDWPKEKVQAYLEERSKKQ